MILEAAAEMFNELGYDATTISGLIDRIQLTRGGLYFHFTSKEELARGVLEEAISLDGFVPQAFKLQEWADLALLLAHRLPREPVLSAGIRLSVDIKAREMFGTRWPDWTEMGNEILTEAKDRGSCCPMSIRARRHGCSSVRGPVCTCSRRCCPTGTSPRRSRAFSPWSCPMWPAPAFWRNSTRRRTGPNVSSSPPESRSPRDRTAVYGLASRPLLEFRFSIAALPSCSARLRHLTRPVSTPTVNVRVGSGLSAASRDLPS